MEHIVLAYDASPGAEAALDWVSWRIHNEAAVVHLLFVTNPLWAEKAQATRNLHAARDQLRRHNPALTVHLLLLDGRKIPTLTRAALDADLLVMGASQRARAPHQGSAALPLRVANRVICPTVLVPEGWTSGSGEPRVMVGIDDDSSSDTAAAFAADEATRLHAPLHLVHAWKTLPSAPGRVRDQVSGDAEIEDAHRRLLNEVAARIRTGWPGLPLELTLVHDNPVSALATAARHADVTVIGSHRRGAITAVILGSVAQDLSRDLHSPLCIVP